ncbi:MAG: putative Diguanylate cyclase/phosphodiesterase [Frankiales bacterium]|nr:putative Diguanylate cyclase/phosphodiesterase [Frankiales bacterium]
MSPAAAALAPVQLGEGPLRLLVIEDSTSDRELVLALLEDELPDARIDIAANLQDALARLDESPHDLVLADLSLPDADGLAVVHAVRAAHPEAALLVLTGNLDGQLAMWALAEGAQDYLVKGRDDGPRLATALLHALHRQRAEKLARGYLQLARGLLDALEAPTCAVATDGRIIAVNAAWLAFTASTDETSPSWDIGANYLSNCERLRLADSHFAPTIAAGEAGLRSVLAGMASRHQHEYARDGDGEELWFSVRVTPAQIDDGLGAVVSHVDVTDMHRVQDELSHQAMHDALTGLPNRLLLTDRLEQALADAARRKRQLGVAFLDLDHFKRINDSLGHAAGDALLLQVAGRLTHLMRVGDTLSRYSGDEFVVVWRDLAAVDDAKVLGTRLTDALSKPFDLGSTSVNLSASVGVVVGDGTGTTDELLMAADAAMYDAKRQGCGRLRVFSHELREGVEELMATEVGLRAGLSRSELVLHYQPVIDLMTGAPVAVEALARWQHPERGLLAPNQFIPVAESSGLIVPLGRWAVEQACLEAAAFSGAAEGLNVAVNLSVRQLTHPDIVSHVREALFSSGLDPNRLMLEVTESAFMDDAEAASLALNSLAELGVRIAIDDFGTGYSSLLYLRRYPIAALKLDRVFVSGIGVNLNDEAICSSVVSLAHAVGATSIGEGVETVEQYAALRALGCRQAQGFLWSAAVPAASLSRVLLACQDIPVPSDLPAPGGRRARKAMPSVDPETASRVEIMRRSGASSLTIAAALNSDDVPCPSRSRWSVASLARYVPVDPGQTRTRQRTWRPRGR